MDLKRLKEEATQREELKKRQEMLEEEKKQKKKLKKLRQAEKRLQNGTIEETFAAMVTIKRADKENMPPSVTVTFQGCTATQEELLTSLVEIQHDNKEQSSNNKTKGRQIKNNSKPAKIPQLSNGPRVVSKNVNVALAVEKNTVQIQKEPTKEIKTVEKSTKKPQEKVVNGERELTKKEVISFGNLVLPPGITLTKVINAQSKSKINYSNSNAPKATPQVNQKGVIVVDTEKLMQQTDVAVKPSSRSRRRKKIKNKSNAESKMVTIRNPTFQMNGNLSNKAQDVPVNQSTIFTKTENGMVKITRGCK